MKSYKDSIKPYLKKVSTKGKQSFYIIIKVYHNGQSTEIGTGIKLDDSRHWDQNTRQVIRDPQRNLYNNELAVAIGEINQFITKMNANNTDFSLNELREYLKADKASPVRQISTEVVSSTTLFTDFMKSEIHKMKINGKKVTIDQYSNTLAEWISFENNTEIKYKVGRMDRTTLLKFRAFLDGRVLKNGNPLSQYTIHNRMKCIRKFWLIAYSKGVIKERVFGARDHNGKKNEILPSGMKGNRRHLQDEELDLVCKYQPVNRSEALSKDVFLFETYTGLRISDICFLKNSNLVVRDNEIWLKFNSYKTGKPIDMMLITKAKEILKKYASKQPNEYVFPLMNNKKPTSELGQEALRNKMESMTAYINKYLRLIAIKTGINMKLSTHVGRNTFAMRSIKRGANLYALQTVLGHQDIKTTQIYLREDEELKRAFAMKLEEENN